MMPIFSNKLNAMKLLLFMCNVILLTYTSKGVHCKNLPDGWDLTHDPDLLRNVSELISSKGYPVEDYVVETKDGFLLSLQRIPHGKNKSHGGKKPVVYLQHGLLSASSDWVLNFPEQSLAFILADLGYDVWLGNTRGNFYSKHHTKLDPSMEEFWNYSFDEMAAYDLPATIDYVLNKTDEEQLIYIGHSLGTTSAFALLSESPLYNKKIKLFVALAPVAHVGHLTRWIYKVLAPISWEIKDVAKFFGIYEFLPHGPIIKFISEYVCDIKEKFICDELGLRILGEDRKHFNDTRTGVYLNHFLDGSSVKTFAHFAQLFNSKKFQKYDYYQHNQEHYNQSTPPDYDLSKITTPTALFWSATDDLADVTDVEILIKELKSLVMSYRVPDDDFTHIDFAIATDAKKLVYDQVIALLQKYT